MVEARLPRLERGTYGLEVPALPVYLSIISICYKLSNSLPTVCRLAEIRYPIFDFPPKSPPDLKRKFKQNISRKVKATRTLGGTGGFVVFSPHPIQTGRRTMAIIASNPDKSIQIKKNVFPLHKERGEKHVVHQIGKAMQASAARGMSLRSLHLKPNTGFAALLDLKGGNFSLKQGLTGVYP